MSAIAGIIDVSHAPVAPGLIENMTAAMSHRGPDGTRWRAVESVAFGHCLLCTTTESRDEAQPLANEDGSLMLVMDGWLSNWVELRQKLQLHDVVLRNTGDAELVLKAFQRWGEDCVQYVEGDFAIAIWCRDTRKLFLARDRMGHKPFYYHFDGKMLAFASELRPLLELPWVPARPNDSMLAEFLAWEWYSRKDTLWQEVFRLEPAHRLVLQGRGLRVSRYWQPELRSAPLYSKDEDYILHYRELLMDSVRRHARTDRSLAVEVSGGLDSAAVLCVADRLHRENKLPAPRLAAYTLQFAAGSAADERTYATAVAEHLGLSVEACPETDVPLSWFSRQAGQSRDFPGFPNSAMFIGLRESAAQQGSRVILTGEGGDSWLDGTPAYYAEELQQRNWACLYELLRADVHSLGVSQSVLRLMRYGVMPGLPAIVQNGVLSAVRRIRGRTRGNTTDRLAAPMAQQLERKRAIARCQPPRSGLLLGQEQLQRMLDDAFSVQVMETLQRHAAQAGLEPRHPMNSHRLVEFAFATPERLRLRGAINKYLHVQAMRGLVPESILSREDKAEFSHALRRTVSRIGATEFSDICQRRPGWLSAEGLRALLKICDGDSQATWPLWVLCGLYGCDKVFTESGKSSGR